MTYQDALRQAIDHWNSDEIEDEWYFERFRREQIDSMSTDRAFAAICETIPFLSSEADESTSCEILQTIINLALQSKTTEVPPSLVRELDSLSKKYDEFGDYSKRKFTELCSYYRI